MAIRSEIIVPNIASAIYKIFDIAEIPIEPTEIELAQTVNGVQYVYQVTIVSEDFANLVDGNVSDWISGKEWAESLDFDTVKLLAWNDSLNTKTVIDEGGEYQMQEGDSFALYTPYWAWVPHKYPEEFVDEFTASAAEGKIGYFYYKVPQDGNPVNFEIEVTVLIDEVNWETKDMNFSCTLLPCIG